MDTVTTHPSLGTDSSLLFLPGLSCLRSFCTYLCFSTWLMRRVFCTHPLHWKFCTATVSYHFSWFNTLRLLLYLLGFWKPLWSSSCLASPSHPLPLASPLCLRWETPEFSPEPSFLFVMILFKLLITLRVSPFLRFLYFYFQNPPLSLMTYGNCIL